MKLPIKSPCPAVPVLTNAGDGTSRCSLCPKRVHHLSEMTENAGKALIARSKTEEICVTYMADRRGHVQFAPALRAVAAAGFMALSPMAMADGGDVVASALAEVNRLQQQSDSTHPTQPPHEVTVATQTNETHNGTPPTSNNTSATELHPEEILMFVGGI